MNEGASISGRTRAGGRLVEFGATFWREKLNFVLNQSNSPFGGVGAFLLLARLCNVI